MAVKRIVFGGQDKRLYWLYCASGNRWSVAEIRSNRTEVLGAKCTKHFILTLKVWNLLWMIFSDKQAASQEGIRSGRFVGSLWFERWGEGQSLEKRNKKMIYLMFNLFWNVASLVLAVSYSGCGCSSWVTDANFFSFFFCSVLETGVFRFSRRQH